MAFLHPLLRRAYYRLRTKLRLNGKDYLMAADDSVLSQSLATILREDLGDMIKNIACPVLIFWGGQDTTTPPSVAQKMAQNIRTVKLVIVPEAGHFSYLDSQEEFCEEIKNFIDSL